jgi:hypothetical protein
MTGLFAVRAAAAALAGATVAALTGAGSAFATTPAPVTIEVITVSPAGGTSTTSGAGLCPSGTTTDQEFGMGGQSGSHANFHDLKTFTCADDSGTFTANVQAQLILGAPARCFTWTIQSGPGAYANLRGSGYRCRRRTADRDRRPFRRRGALQLTEVPEPAHSNRNHTRSQPCVRFSRGGPA